MGHMNVRFYVTHAVDGARSFLTTLGLSSRDQSWQGVTLRVVEHHLRFHREMRAGQGILLRGHVVAADEETLDLYQDIFCTDDDTLCATVRTRVGVVRSTDSRAERFSKELVKRAEAYHAPIPDHGLPRGLSISAARAAPTVAEADELGFLPSYRGVVAPSEIDDRGVALAESFMGRISDGVVHFFQQLGLLERDAANGVGGAALEYHIHYRAWPRLYDVLDGRFGLKAQAAKTTRFVHWMFDAATGECVMSAEAVAVMFDLESRKAIAPDERTLELLRAKANQALSA
jgi:acyl-CoA thioester hydrolase